MSKKADEEASVAEPLKSKADAVRRALGELGPKASPTEIQSFIKTRFDVDMTTKVISVYKSKLGKQKPQRGRKPGRAHAAAGADSPHAISLRDLRTLKDLKDRHGPTRLRELLELVAL